jgi:RNA polymerase sigma-70 factor (ECF subfamily)
MEPNALEQKPSARHLSLAPARPDANPSPAEVADLCTHRQLLESVALRLCRDHADAHDLVQDTLERALRARARLRPGSNVRGWLLSILRNRFLDLCRHGSEQKRAALDDLPELAAPESHEEEPSWASISTEELRRAVDQLPLQYRCVYEMHALQGLPYQRISAELGIPLNTVGTRLIRARRRLRDLLTAAGEEAPRNSPPKGNPRLRPASAGAQR